MRRYGTFTAKRRAALRKAQLASAAKRRGRGKSKARTYAKRTAKTVGVLGAVAAAGYGAHKASGSKFIVSTRIPTVSHHVTGRPIGRTGLHRTNGAVSYVNRNHLGDKHIVYAAGVNGVFGSKLRGHPSKVTQYKPPRAHISRGAFKKSNYPHTQEAIVANNRRFRSRRTPTKIGISEAEALRRTRSYVSAREVNGRQISAAERTRALRKYRTQGR